MQHRRKWRVRAGTAAALLITALVPAALGGQADAASPTAAAASTGAAQAAAAIQKAVAQGGTFNPTHAFEPGVAQTLETSNSSLTPDGSSKPAPANANANGGSLGLTATGSLETPQGPAQTTQLSNGDSLEIYGLGSVVLDRPDGSAVWQRSTGSLYRDWKLAYDVTSYTPTPQLVQGTDVADPFDIVADEPYVVDDTQTYAVGDLAGDGGTDIAVAETVGINLGLSDCFCAFPFTVPGSNLHLGTFVTVLDSKTGATVYSELEPGFVTQLAISGNRLIVGDETGSGQSIGQSNDFGLWDSETNVSALSMHRAAGGRLTASQVWSYSTGAQWGRLLGMQTIGSNVAVSWSDTPVGLGVPGPPDGHVVLLDGNGRVAWDQRTAGYPVLSKYDPSRGLLAVVEQTDPTQAVSYQVAGLRLTDGRTVTDSTVEGSMPTALTIGALTRGGPTSWLVAGIATDTQHVAPPAYAFNAGDVTALDPSTGRQKWSATLADSGPDAPQPGSVAVAYGSNGAAVVLVGSSAGAQQLTAATPVTEVDDLQALSGSSGAELWDRSGDVSTPLSLSASGATVRGVTTEHDAVTYDVTSGRTTGTEPLFGSLYAVVSADIRGDGKLDEIAGGQDGAVYAFDGDEITNPDGAPNVLWRMYLGGTIQQIVQATVDGRKELVVVTSTGLATLDQRTGRLLHSMPLPGQFVWNVAVGTVGGRTVIATADDRVSAFDAASGAVLWTYRPPVTASFSDPAIVDGVLVTDYSNLPAVGQSATAMAAIGLDAGTGRLKWSAEQDPSTTNAAQLAAGVVAGPGIPGAGADGAVFTWQTSDGEGRADVRNAETGALIYSNTSPDLWNHENYLLSPTVGLVSAGAGGMVSITPAGPADDDWISDGGIALAHSDGKPVLITSSVGINAYPVSVIGDNADVPSPLTSLETFTSTNVYVNGDDQVIGMQGDQATRNILFNEVGVGVPFFALAVQEGLVVAGLTGDPAANAAVEHAQAPKKAQAAPKPTTVPLAGSAASAGRLGDVQPSAQLKVHGYSASGMPQLTSTDPSGYSPALMQSYLGLHGTGAGQTVAVVDAPGNPDIAADVDQFSAQFGLPQACSATQKSGCFDFTVDTPQGSGTVDPGWGLETSLDVEWIHAIAPQASIVLVEAHDPAISSMFAAVAAAAKLKPDAISLSWGMQGEFTDETYYDRFCKLSDSLCVASTGDFGYPSDYPAYNPSVLAIGGTSLQLAGDGSVLGETAWSNTGGGQSYVEPAPAYQSGVVSGGRGTPDVSFDADPATGVPVYDSTPDQGQSGWFQVGGTSVGAPAWSAILTVTDQLRAAAGKPALASDTAQQALYGSAASLGDVTSGDNGQCPVCTAGPGYDFVTGLGSPRNGIDSTLAGIQ